MQKEMHMNWQRSSLVKRSSNYLNWQKSEMWPGNRCFTCNATTEIFGSLFSAGLTINFFHEYTFCAWDPFPDMEQDEDKFWRFKDPQKRKMIPLMFSLKATKLTM